MNTREIKEEIVAAIYDEMRKNGAQPAEASAACVKISAILDRHLEGKVAVPRQPTRAMLNAADGICSQVGNGPMRAIQWPDAVGPEDVWEAMIAEEENGD